MGFGARRAPDFLLPCGMPSEALGGIIAGLRNEKTHGGKDRKGTAYGTGTKPDESEGSVGSFDAV